MQIKKNKQAEITEELSEKQSGKNIDVEKNAEKKVTREPGSIKKICSAVFKRLSGESKGTGKSTRKK